MARLKDKVTIAQDEKYLTYGMVLCFETLTDLYVCRAGLSASAELLVSLQRGKIYYSPYTTRMASNTT